MKLQGRNLSLRMQGEDVELLKGELRKLGFTVEATEADFGRNTHQAVLEFQRTHTLEATGVVDEATATQINADVDALPDDGPQRFIVRGQIRHGDGSPFVGSIVQAFDQDLRSTQELDRRETNPEGRFELTYTAEDFARSEKGHADLTFQIENRDGVNRCTRCDQAIRPAQPSQHAIDVQRHWGTGLVNQRSKGEAYGNPVVIVAKHHCWAGAT